MRRPAPGRVAEQNDPEVVRREYSDEKGLAGRQSLWARRRGGHPLDVAFEEVVALRPRRVLEVGCGQGEFAERLVAHGLDVVAVDQSERMVELTRARGVDARIGDIQGLPFVADEFDLVVANFVLYHVPDLQRGLAELARVSPVLVSSRRRTGSATSRRCGPPSIATSGRGRISSFGRTASRTCASTTERCAWSTFPARSR